MSEDPAEHMPTEASYHSMAMRSALSRLKNECLELEVEGLISLVATATADRSANPVIKIAAPHADARIREQCGEKMRDRETVTYATTRATTRGRVQVEWTEPRPRP